MKTESFCKISYMQAAFKKMEALPLYHMQWIMVLIFICVMFYMQLILI